MTQAIVADAKFLSKILPEDVGGKLKTVQFVLGNGTRMELSLDDIPEATVIQLALHGLSQKGGDSASGFSKAKDFSSAYAAIQGTLDNLRNGVWSSRAGSSTSDLVQAIAKILKLELQEAQAKVDLANEEQLSAIRKNPQIKQVIAQIQAERAKEAAKQAPGLGELLKGIGL